MILDTSIIIALRRNDERAVRSIAQLRQEGMPLHVTSITIAELASATPRSNAPRKEQERITTILLGQHVLDLDANSAQRAGTIHGQLTNHGTPVGILDCLIGGIALAHNEPILTLNPKDFARMPGLTVRTP